MNITLVEATIYDNITEKDGRQEVLSAIRSLNAENAELRGALRAYEKEHAQNECELGIDAGMSFPPDECDCSNCRRARAVLAKYEAK